MIADTYLICGRTYAVTLQPMMEACGACCNERQSITIDSDSHPETQASVLVHEIFEAMNASMNLDLPHTTISALETAWYAVLTQNKEWWT